MNKWLGILPALMPLCLAAADPVFQVPMDGSADVVGKKNEKITSGAVSGTAEYSDGVVGKALKLNAKASIKFQKLPDMSWNAGTVSFWVKPEWKQGTASNWIVSSHDSKWKGFRFYLLETKEGAFDFSLCAPGQIQFVGKSPFKTGEWTHVAFNWDVKKSEVHLFFNGKLFGKRAVASAHKEFEPLTHWIEFGNQKNSGGILLDDVKIYNQVLPSAEMEKLAVRKTK